MPRADTRDGLRAVTPQDRLQTQAAKAQVTPVSVTAGAGRAGQVPPRRVELLLALSDERDQWERWVLAAAREAYRAGRRAGYERGYVDGVEARKHAQHMLVDLIGTHLARWDGLRRDFGKPRPGDYAGGPVAWNGGQRP